LDSIVANGKLANQKSVCALHEITGTIMAVYKSNIPVQNSIPERYSSSELVTTYNGPSRRQPLEIKPQLSLCKKFMDSHKEAKCKKIALCEARFWMDQAANEQKR
jgi:hypothetical protein